MQATPTMPSYTGSPTYRTTLTDSETNFASHIESRMRRKSETRSGKRPLQPPATNDSAFMVVVRAGCRFAPPSLTTASLDCWNRTYDPSTARWTTPDPAASPWTNIRSYCGANPVTGTDPSGLFSIDPNADFGNDPDAGQKINDLVFGKSGPAPAHPEHHGVAPVPTSEEIEARGRRAEDNWRRIENEIDWWINDRQTSYGKKDRTWGYTPDKWDKFDKQDWEVVGKLSTIFCKAAENCPCGGGEFASNYSHLLALHIIEWVRHIRETVTATGSIGNVVNGLGGDGLKCWGWANLLSLHLSWFRWRLKQHCEPFNFKIGQMDREGSIGGLGSHTWVVIWICGTPFHLDPWYDGRIEPNIITRTPWPTERAKHRNVDERKPEDNPPITIPDEKVGPG